MIDEQGKTINPNRVSKLKIFTPIIAVVVAFATFDAQLGNFELFTFALQDYLPELAALMLISLIIMSYRTNFWQVIFKHQLLSLLIISIISISVYYVSYSRAKSENWETRYYKSFLRQPKHKSKMWLKSRKDAYSRKQISLFRHSMKIDAFHAYRRGQFDLTRNYLTAATRQLEGYGKGGDEAKKALEFLTSREVYLSNHDARFKNLDKNFRITPLGLYLLQAQNAINPTSELAQKISGYRVRISAAQFEAENAVTACINSGKIEVLSKDAVVMLNYNLNAIGNIPTYYSPEQSQKSKEWCERLKTIQSDYNDYVQKAGELDTSDIKFRGDMIEFPTEFIDYYRLVASTHWESTEI